MRKIITIIILITSSCLHSHAYSQQTIPKGDFLMFMDIKLDPSAVIDKGMRIVNIPGGVVSGPNIKGTVHPPSADWVQILPSGAFKLDVRLLVKTDDGDTIYISYNGILKHSEQSLEKIRKGEEITSDDGWYFVAAPTFRTSSKKYDYLNSIQAINIYKTMRLGTDGGYVRVEVFAMK